MAKATHVFEGPFYEPPNDIWFDMGEYMPPHFVIIQLAAIWKEKTPTCK